MRTKRAYVALMALGLLLILSTAPFTTTAQLSNSDLSSIATFLGISLEFTRSLETAEILEAIVARLPVRDSTGMLMIEALTLSSSFEIGQSALLAFSTLPGAECEIDITYLATGRSPASLHQTTKIASPTGRVEWTWTIGTNEPTKAIATVRARFDTLELTAGFPFYITD